VSAIDRRAARVMGETWEAEIARLLSVAPGCHVHRIPTPVAVMGKTTQDARGRATFRGAFSARQGVDLAGYITAGDRPMPVAIEAKAAHVSGRWSFADALGLSRSAPMSHAACMLDRYDHDGALAVVMLLAYHAGRECRVMYRWRALHSAWLSGIASIPWADIDDVPSSAPIVGTRLHPTPRAMLDALEQAALHAERRDP